ncbi:MAG: chalcone isomerase family protein [Chitinophagales bacterium]|nr:chalcone isomerase family protein [Chitinophagales bacterium]
MKLNRIPLVFFMLLFLASEAQVTINGVALPASVKQGNTDLVLNGGGIRKKLFFKVYTGGLYLAAKSKNAAEILAADKPMAFRLTITSSVINSSNMSEAIQEGFGKSMKGNTSALQSKIDVLVNTFKSEEIKEGDMFELMYVPGEGVKASKNGKLKSTIAGLDFKKALFGIWVGEDPVDADLKAALLGN